MALSTYAINTTISTQRAEQTDATNAIDTITVSGVSNYHIDAVQINNPNNANVVYIKIYDNSSPTVGTTDPEIILQGNGSGTTEYLFEPGLLCATAFKVACTTTAGTGGTTSPTNDVSYVIAFHTS
jgi:hypothetical protein